MVPIKKNLVSDSMMYYKGISESKGRSWRYIIVHNTANDASAANEITYMRGNTEYTSFHYAVDDKEIVQGLPDNIGAFDTSNRSFSAGGLSVEIGYSKSGGTRFTQAERNAAEFIAYKLKSMGYPCDSAHVKTHKDATGKYCPHRTLDMGWTRFMNMIKSYMITEDEDMTETQVKAIVNSVVNSAVANMTAKMSEIAAKAATEAIQSYFDAEKAKPRSDWADHFWRAAVANGVFDGTMPGAPLTREQAATTYSKMGLLELSDSKAVSDFAKEAWNKAIEQNIIDGSSPKSPATREQVITMLNNLGALGAGK